MIIHLCTTNDRNGNPRRAWAVFAPNGLIIDFFEEGYVGRLAVPPELRDRAYNAPSINVSAGEWNSWRKAAIDHNNRKDEGQALDTFTNLCSV